MKFNDFLLDDLGRLANGAASVLGGFRDQFTGRPAGDTAGGISREEFESVRDMAAKARELQEDFSRRLSALEARLASRDQEKQ